MINRHVAALLVLIAPLAACVSGSSGSGDSNPNSGFQARFVPLGGVMPFPNDLYFNGSKTGTLNIPGSATVAQNAPLLALNHLDGFGTESDISIYFTEAVDPTTLASNVFVFQVTSSATTKALTGFTKPLVIGTDYSIGLSPGADAANEIVTIKPLKPLAASTVSGTTPVPATYLVVVTNGVKSASGAPVTASADYSAILGADTIAGAPVSSVTKINMASSDPLLPVAEFTYAQLAVAYPVIHAINPKFTTDDVAVTFSFSTAYLGLSLAELSASAAPTAQPTGVGIVDTGLNVCDALAKAGELPNNTTACASVPGSTAVEVFAGTVALPYYLTVPATGSTAALTDFWHNSKGGDTAISTDPTSILPVATVKQNVIPILVAAPLAGGPCGAVPAGGWPTVVFQHGITRNREDMLGIASTLVIGGVGSGFCTAVVAIDLPLHGVTNTSDASIHVKGHERTFDMSATGVAGAPGANIGTSGAQFINLVSTITSRDNLREGAADLINLVATLPNLAAGSNTFNSHAVFFVGHSLGGIVGTTFLGADSAGSAVPGSLHLGVPVIIGAVVANPAATSPSCCVIRPNSSRSSTRNSRRMAS